MPVKFKGLHLGLSVTYRVKIKKKKKSLRRQPHLNDEHVRVMLLITWVLTFINEILLK